MKIIRKITKSDMSWVGECVDGELVSLSTWLTDNDVIAAVHKNGWNCNNVFKIRLSNKYIPLGHPLGGYEAREGTKVYIG